MFKRGRLSDNYQMKIPKLRLQFSENLRKERQKSGLTQEKIAEMINISARYYQMLESKNPPAVKIDTIEKLAKALRIKPSKLLNS